MITVELTDEQVRATLSSEQRAWVRRLLRDYGRHMPFCQAGAANPYACTCGLTNAKLVVKEKP